MNKRPTKSTLTTIGQQDNFLRFSIDFLLQWLRISLSLKFGDASKRWLPSSCCLRRDGKTISPVRDMADEGGGNIKVVVRCRPLNSRGE